jgi:hypothetical protein
VELAARLTRSLAALAVAAAVLAPAAHATYLGHNGKIAYARGGEVWTMDPDGTNQSRLLTDAVDPAWSADGRRIAFGCELVTPRISSHVCTANADGTSRNVLDNFGRDNSGDPSWSPDGLRLAVELDYGCDHHVCFSEVLRVNAADGSDPIGMSAGSVDASWGVNGQIASMTRRIFGFPPEGVATSIVLVRASVPNVYTTLPESDGAAYPDWAPDGERLLYRKSDGFHIVDPEGSSVADIAVDGGEPAWSPDGTKIVFSRFITLSEDTPPFAQSDLFVMNADGTGEQRLTNTVDVNEAAPAWQPAPQDAYPYPASASPVRVSLVPAFEQCRAPNRTHGPPLAFDACAPPAERAGFMTFGSAPRGTSPKAVGHVRLAAVPGDPDSVNRADVKVSVALSDVRRGFDLADGPGSLELVLPVRITDLSSGPFGSDHQATVTDLDDYMTNPLRALVPCTETANPGVGSTCELTTTANALVPGPQNRVQERRRAIWQLDQLAVWDGGEDGFIESRDDNAVLAVQGVFVP